MDPEMPLILHEENTVNGLEFSPFNENMLGCACQDGSIAIWTIPDGGLKNTLTKPTSRISVADKRMMSIDFHPLAEGVAIGIDATKQVHFIDLAAEKEKFCLPDVHKALLTNLSWNYEGTECATSCKDKTVRLFDPRSKKCTGEAPDHQGAKGGRVVWLHKKNQIFTCGFGKGNERQLALYDPRKLSQRIALQQIDVGPSSMMPFYDQDNHVMFVAGKGDGNIRAYEIIDEEPFFYLVNEYKAKEAQSGMAALPKTSCDVMNCVIMNFMKLTSQGLVIPVKFAIPRKENMFFQEDIFPDTVDVEHPVISANEWFSGGNKAPRTFSLNPEKKK